MNAKRAYFPIVLINAFDLVSFNEQIDMEESKLFNEEDCDEDGMNASCPCSGGCSSNSGNSGCPCQGGCGGDHYARGNCPCQGWCGSSTGNKG